MFNDGCVTIVCDLEFLKIWTLLCYLWSSKRLCKALVGAPISFGFFKQGMKKIWRSKSKGSHFFFQTFCELDNSFFSCFFVVAPLTLKFQEAL